MISNVLRRVARVAANGLLFIAVTAAMIVLAEGALRWHYREVLSTSSGVDYFWNRSHRKFAKERNALGIRGRHFDVASRHALRVVMMGDSFTYGQGVYPYDQRFPEQAAVMFSKKYPDMDVEFINIGMCGADLPIYNKQIVDFVATLHPDFILYQWFINDMDVSSDFYLFQTPPLILNKGLHDFLINHSVFYFILEIGWKQLMVMFQGKHDYKEYLIKKFRNQDNKYLDAAKNELIQLMDKLKNKKISYGIVLFSDLSLRQAEYRFGFLHEEVLKICNDRQVDCLDLRAAYKEYDNDVRTLWANVFDHHPSVLAHRVAAEKIVNFFGASWRRMALNKKAAGSGKG